MAEQSIDPNPTEQHVGAPAGAPLNGTHTSIGSWRPGAGPPPRLSTVIGLSGGIASGYGAPERTHYRPGPHGAAFFDLDKTLIQGASGFHFAVAARQAGLVTRRQLVLDGFHNLRYRMRGATDDETEALRKRVAETLTGVRARDLDRLGARVMQRILPRLYPEILTIAYEHQDEGRPVYIVTAASEGLAEMLATVLSFDGALGSNLGEIADGVYTGRSGGHFLYGPAKAEAISALADRENIDLEKSYAYSDSVSDLPMLEVVGHPVVVNPDAELLARAQEGGWQVLNLDPLGRRLAGMGLVAGLIVVGLFANAVSARREARRATAAHWTPPKPTVHTHKRTSRKQDEQRGKQPRRRKAASKVKLKPAAKPVSEPGHRVKVKLPPLPSPRAHVGATASDVREKLGLAAHDAQSKLGSAAQGAQTKLGSTANDAQAKLDAAKITLAAKRAAVIESGRRRTPASVWHRRRAPGKPVIDSSVNQL